MLRDMQIIKERCHKTRVLISDPKLFWRCAQISEAFMFRIFRKKTGVHGAFCH
jgi:hypothetical protein